MTPSGRLGVGLFAALLFAGCSSIQVKTDASPDAAAKAANYQTYAWLDAPSEDPTDRVHDATIGQEVRAAVDQQLAGKGYRRADSGQADFHIGWHASVERKTEVEAINPYYGYFWDPTYFGPPYGMGFGGTGGWTGAPQTYAREYDEGELVLDVVDGASGQLVWRGSASAEVSSSPKARAERIEKATAKILERFPPEQ